MPILFPPLIGACAPDQQNETPVETPAISFENLNQDPDYQKQVENFSAFSAESLGNRILLWGNTPSSNELTLVTINPFTNEQETLSVTLPYQSQRSYDNPIALEDGRIVMTYQSDPAFINQSGTDHGFVVINPESQEIENDIFLPVGSNPSGLVTIEDKIYVLLSNRNLQTDGRFSIAVFDTNDFTEIANQEIDSVSIGGSDIAVYEQDGQTYLAVSTTSSYELTSYQANGSGGVNESYSEGGVVIIDPEELSVTEELTTSHGLGMSLATNGENIYVSGSETQTQDGFGVLNTNDENPAIASQSLQSTLERSLAEHALAGGIFPSQFSLSQDGAVLSSLIDYQAGSQRHQGFAFVISPDGESSFTFKAEDTALISPFVLVSDGDTEMGCVTFVGATTNDQTQFFNSDVACYNLDF